MELKDFEAKLAEIKTALEAKAKADTKIEIADQLKAIEEAGKEAKEKKDAELKEISDRLEVTIKAFDMLQTRVKATPITGGIKTFGGELGEKLQAKEKELKEFKQTKRGFGDIQMDSKAVGDMSSPANLTGTYFVQPTLVPGVQLKPYEQVHLRNILPVGQTNSNVIRYVRDNGGEGGPGMVAEGATKPQIDRDLEVVDAPVRKIATYFRVPEEMIDDIPYLQSFLAQIGMEEIMKMEDQQILYGDGLGQNLEGLFTAATDFAYTGGTIPDANNFDVLMAAKLQGKISKYNVNIALMAPEDYFEMTQKKDTTNNYLFLGGGNGIDVNNTINRGGLRIIEHTEVEAGDFLVFDPTKAAIFDRTGTTIRFYDQDRDNAIKNLITIVIEKRLALPIYQPDAFIKGTFAAAKVLLA